MQLDLWWILGLVVVYAVCLVLAKLSRHVGIAVALMMIANATVLIFLLYTFGKG